ncbi:hypothetical protein [Stenotrophomonas rhizophila]|uniref:ApeA N-terminal domain-containing protein n=1 Tax=Stenotrophomonas rhizophila TaxID=216778 RepID=A0AAW5PMJ7_9GAMM|nr:hypothetical protein [Stenotrophomonas rhizophila]MCS4281570.1 hypothetical protein [Stenotrophomonas rhizophila]
MRAPTEVYVGNFKLDEAGEAIGQLSIAGSGSELVLNTTFSVDMESIPHEIHGRSIKGEAISCIGCIPRGQTNTIRGDDSSYTSSTVFPHYVVIGREFLDQSVADIDSVSFTTDELGALVGDRLAFGWMFPKPEDLKTLIGESREEVFEGAQVAYFNGKTTIAELETELGLISIFNSPSGGSGTAHGVGIKNAVRISVHMGEPVTLDEAATRILVILRFLTVLSGRHQTAHQFSARRASQDEFSLPDTVHVCMARASSAEKLPTSLRFDLPLDAATRTEEFCSVMSSWIARDPKRIAARVQHANGIEYGNLYTTNRLVAAANMFDLLPKEDCPQPPELPASLLAAANQARLIFRDLPVSPQRDSMLQAISRLGSSTLTSKVKHRGEILLSSLEPFFPELLQVLRLAVKCRNYFVHGPSGDLDYQQVYPFLPFFTEALEFTFSVSELIECGWDVERWSTAGHTMSHSFTEFRASYRERLKELIATGLIKAT